MTRRRSARSRGGKGGAEPRTRIIERQRVVIERTLSGESQHQIAATLGISQAAVSKILRRADDQTLQELRERGLRVKARQLQQLEHIRAEAISAWHRSKADAVRRRQRRTDGAGVGTAVAEVVTEAQHGDPRYLAEARNALSDQRKLLGLDAPQQVQLDARPFAHLTDEQVADELRRQEALLKVVGVLPAPSTKPEGGDGH